MEWIRIAVTAAELIFKGPGKGQEKMAYIRSFLDDKGINSNTDAINEMIENEVRKLSSNK